MKAIPAFTIATLICSPALASETQFAGSTLDFRDLPEISNADPNEIHIKSYAFDGDGCPEGTAAMQLTPDGRSLSILLSEFFVQTPYSDSGNAPGFEEVMSKSVSCEISFTLHVPEDKALRLVEYDYRGAAYPALDLGPQSGTPSTVLESFYEIYGIPGEIRHEFFTSDAPGFVIGHTLILNDQLPSDCGEDVNVTTLTNLSINGYGGSIFLDSIDSASGMKYGFEWRPCEL